MEESKSVTVPSLSEWLKEEMKKNPDFRDMIMSRASPIDIAVYELQEFESKDR